MSWGSAACVRGTARCFSSLRSARSSVPSSRDTSTRPCDAPPRILTLARANRPGRIPFALGSSFCSELSETCALGASLFGVFQPGHHGLPSSHSRVPTSQRQRQLASHAYSRIRQPVRCGSLVRNLLIGAWVLRGAPQHCVFCSCRFTAVLLPTLGAFSWEREGGGQHRVLKLSNSACVAPQTTRLLVSFLLTGSFFSWF